MKIQGSTGALKCSDAMIRNRNLGDQKKSQTRLPRTMMVRDVAVISQLPSTTTIQLTFPRHSPPPHLARSSTSDSSSSSSSHPPQRPSRSPPAPSSAHLPSTPSPTPTPRQKKGEKYPYQPRRTRLRTRYDSGVRPGPHSALAHRRKSAT